MRHGNKNAAFLLGLLVAASTGYGAHPPDRNGASAGGIMAKAAFATPAWKRNQKNKQRRRK